jgi:methylphosphotriester-DNA--protein-cysteine methyltransferase
MVALARNRDASGPQGRASGTTVRAPWLAAVAQGLLQHAIARLPPPRSPFERLVLGGLLIECAYRLQAQRPLERTRSRRGPQPPPDDHLLRLCQRARQAPVAAFRAWVRAFFRDVLAAHPPSLGQEAALLLRRAAGNSLSLRALARRLETTPATLRRAIQREFGCSVKRYQTRVRVLAALADGDLTPVRLVAARGGYRSRKDLYRACLQTLGITLSAFRRLPPAARRNRLVAGRAALVATKNPTHPTRPRRRRRARFHS